MTVRSRRYAVYVLSLLTAINFVNYVDRMVILSQRRLKAVLAECILHYNGRRPHRFCELFPSRPIYPVAKLTSQRIKRQGRPRWPDQRV